MPNSQAHRGMKPYSFAPMQRIHWGVLGLGLLTACGGRSGQTVSDTIETPTFVAPAVPHEATIENALGEADYIVVLKDAPPDGVANHAARMARSYGGTPAAPFAHVLHGYTTRATAPQADSLARDPSVAWVERVRTVYATAVESNPPSWGIDRIDQRELPLSTSYTYMSTGEGVHVYLVDTGLRSTHVEFTGRVGEGTNFVPDDLGTEDCSGHGTHVAGIVGGTVSGVAKGVTLHPVRILDCEGKGTSAGVISALAWILGHAQSPAVVNMSIGAGVSPSMDEAVRVVVASGIPVVVAAGNNNADACLSSPARAPDALTVGATTNTDARGSYSNYGACIDVFAPGSNILSAYAAADTSAAVLTGTSMAAPHVTGAVALLLSMTPKATPAEVAAALLNNATADKVTNGGADSPNRLLFTGPASVPEDAGVEPQDSGLQPDSGLQQDSGLQDAGSDGQDDGQDAGDSGGATCTGVLSNGGFEAVRTWWTQRSTQGAPLVCTAATCGVRAQGRTGNYVAWLGKLPNEFSELGQTLLVPEAARLSFWYRVDSSDLCSGDSGSVQIEVGGVAQRVVPFDLCAATSPGKWINRQVDLSAYAGMTAAVWFRVRTNGTSPSSLWLDDVNVLAGASCLATGMSTASYENP
ncbi:MAG: S8 family serine peptidase [Myxococcales bacterium]